MSKIVQNLKTATKGSMEKKKREPEKRENDEPNEC